MRIAFSICGVLGLAAVVLATGIGCPKSAGEGSPRGSGGGKPVPVLGEAAVRKDMPVEISTFGTIESQASQAVRAEVGGILQEVHFSQGQMIQKDALLFTIDKRWYESELNRFKAAHARNTVLAANARKNAQRDKKLLDDGYAAPAVYDRSLAEAESLDAQVTADDAAVKSAQLMLDRCEIRSKVDGIAGSLAVDVGNVVRANDQTLVTIRQVQPIEAVFSAPQQHLGRIRQEMARGKLAVSVRGIEKDSQSETGQVTFIDNSVDATTGTIRLTATFDNKGLHFWPGQHVKVTLTLSVDRNVVVVPSRAVQTGRDSQFVYVIDAQKKAVFTPVTVARTNGLEAIIAAGLTEGQQVVIDGHSRLKEGDKVELKKEIRKTGETEVGRQKPEGTTKAAAKPAQSTVPATASRPAGP